MSLSSYCRGPFTALPLFMYRIPWVTGYRKRPLGANKHELDPRDTDTPDAQLNDLQASVS
jgi:hypothetical protein